MLKFTSALCLVVILTFLTFDRTGAYFVKRGSTWVYTCRNDAECQKRGHAFCSFAAAEQKNGEDIGWCQPSTASGPKPGPLPVPPGPIYPVEPEPYPNPYPKPQPQPQPQPLPLPAPQPDPSIGRWYNDIAGGKCWWTGCQSTQHRDKCPAATAHVHNQFSGCRAGEVNVICCRE